MAIGTIIIGGGIDTELFSTTEELVYRTSTILTTIRANSYIKNDISANSSITQSLSLSSKVMERYIQS